MISKHGALEGGQYLDPRSKKTFAFDHLRKEATNVQDAEVDAESEGLRSAVDAAVKAYAEDHYPAGVSSVCIMLGHLGYADIDICSIRCLLKATMSSSASRTTSSTPTISGTAAGDRNGKFGVSNFIPKSDHANRTFNKSSGALKGVLKVQVHYYEDGNVQLVSQKKVGQVEFVSLCIDSFARLRPT